GRPVGQPDGGERVPTPAEPGPDAGPGPGQPDRGGADVTGQAGREPADPLTGAAPRFTNPPETSPAVLQPAKPSPPQSTDVPYIGTSAPAADRFSPEHSRELLAAAGVDPSRAAAVVDQLAAPPPEPERFAPAEAHDLLA